MSATRLPVKRPPWARALHRWRRDREETQDQLAARLGVSIAWLSHLETGYRRPSAEIVEKLRAVGFESGLPVRHPVEVAVTEVRTVVVVDPDDVPLADWGAR